MRDIVATIPAEQDEIIQLDHPEVLVIEGGPGTGKTVVALHRVTLLGVLKQRRLSTFGQRPAVSAVDQLSRLFDVDDLDVEDTPPNPNVAPTEPVHAALERQGRRALVTLRGA